jgi:hypothetical protein
MKILHRSSEAAQMEINEINLQRINKEKTQN